MSASASDETLSHYAVLELDPRASSEDIRKAHRRLALKWHPDKVADSSDEVAVKVATQQFQLLQAAFEVLSDERKRRQYDAQLGGRAGVSFAQQEDIPPWKRSRPSARTPWTPSSASSSSFPKADPEAAARTWAHGEKAELRVPSEVPTVAAAVDQLPVRGGIIHVESGYYEGVIVISKPFVKIWAAGENVVIQGQVVFRECAMGAHLKGLRIEATCPAGAVDLKGVRGKVLLERCVITNTASAALVLEGCSGDTVLQGCQVRGSRYDGLGLHKLKGESTHRGRILATDCDFEDNGYDGLYLGDPRYEVTLRSCTVRRNLRHGICVRGSQLETIDCVFEANGKEAIHREEYREPRGSRQTLQGPRELDGAGIGLPEQWRAFRTAEGLTYYYHAPTGTTQWSHPAEASTSPSTVDPSASSKLMDNMEH